MDNIKLVKHISGLEFIGALRESSDDGRVLLSGAFQVVTQQVGNQLQMTLVPICVTVDGSNKGLPAAFECANLIGVYTPAITLLELYQRMIGSIITPHKTQKLVRN